MRGGVSAAVKTMKWLEEHRDEISVKFNSVKAVYEAAVADGMVTSWRTVAAMLNELGIQLQPSIVSWVQTNRDKISKQFGSINAVRLAAAADGVSARHSKVKEALDEVGVELARPERSLEERVRKLEETVASLKSYVEELEIESGRRTV